MDGSTGVEPSFASIGNFRDFGGAATRSGGRVRRGMLYRSAGHSLATDADLEALAGLQIATLIDLRRPDERRRAPSRRPPGFTGTIIESDEEAEDEWRAHIGRGDVSEAAFRRFQLDYYRGAPFHVRHLDLFRRYFAALASTAAPVLIHCSAGKDRTGILACLTLRLLDVPDEAIAADYLATNDPKTLEARVQHVARLIAEIAGRPPSRAATLIAMGVELAYLETALAAICGRYRDLDSYLETALGVDALAQAAIRDRLIE